MNRMRWTVISLLAALLPAVSCNRKPDAPAVVHRAPRMAAPTSEESADASREALLKDLDPVPRLRDGKTFVAPDGESWTLFDNGLMIQELHIGLEGQPPQTGQTVSVAYVGTLPGTNKEFDRSKPDQPLTFKMGTRDLIKGFSIGISTMHIAGKRRIYLPPDLAYGAAGKPEGGIGPNQPLIFEIELLSVTGQALTLPPEKKVELMGPPALGATTSAPATAPATQAH